MFGEMNNGRVLTLMDLGRFTAGTRLGLMAVLRREGWGLAVAGGSTRYRRRISPFARIEMRTRIVGWDARFFYVLQEMWVRGECAAQALLRTAVTAPGRGAVRTGAVLAALGRDDPRPRPARLDRRLDRGGRGAALAARGGLRRCAAAAGGPRVPPWDPPRRPRHPDRAPPARPAASGAGWRSTGPASPSTPSA